MLEEVLLVDALDREVGVSEKLAAHRSSSRHRAVSALLFNDAGALLLQRRALGKYHSRGLWSNTCCGHPRPGETVIAAARRRLFEEMRIRCELSFIAAVDYRVDLEPDTDLHEHECDHIFVGTFDGRPDPDPQEVEAWEWMRPPLLRAQLTLVPASFSAWFPLLLGKVQSWLANATAASQTGCCCAPGRRPVGVRDASNVRDMLLSSGWLGLF